VLEDISDPETAAWVTAQNGLTESFLAAVPAREAIRSGLTRFWNYPRLGVPVERGGRWFQARNSGLQNQPVLYLMAAPDDEVIRSSTRTRQLPMAMPQWPRSASARTAAQRGDAPVLLRVGTSAGHSGGKPTGKAIAEAADRLAFLESALGAAAGPVHSPHN
jgi:prolyl oligopeptidase PreP (S9A serine peptidase family)